MPTRKIIIYLKQKRFVFGRLKAKYWAEIESGIVGHREGFRNINIYEAELVCKKSVVGFGAIHSGEAIKFSNQDKLRKKFNAITFADSSGANPATKHDRDVSDVEELANANSDNEKIAKAFRKYIKDYNNYFVRSFETNFITSFPTPLKTTIKTENGIEQYALNFESAKLYNFKISKVQDEGAESSGTIEGAFIGYIVDFIEQEIEVEITPEPTPFAIKKGTKTYPYLTGKSEAKTVSRVNYRRYEVCEAPGDYNWSDWKEIGKISEPQRIYTFWEALLWLFVFFIFLALLIHAWPLLLAIVIIAGLTWLFSLNISGKIFGFLGRLIGGILMTLSVVMILGGLIALVVNADLFGRNHPTVRNVNSEGQQQEQVVDNDTIISQYREWDDYHGNHYSGYLRVRASDYRNSRFFRMNYGTVGGETEYSKMCTSISGYDSSSMKLIYQFFDSLRTEKNLTRDQFAEAVVTCVQDIPYYLITPGPCDYSAYPKSDFAHNYLLGGGLCEGYETNGILSPVEFSATIKGDCDTRTVFAYTILKHFGYAVGVYGSDYYSHSILGISLENKPTHPVVTRTDNETTYSMCELTTYGPKLGQLPDEVSDMTKWRLELK